MNGQWIRHGFSWYPNRTFAGIESKVLGHKVKVDAILGERFAVFF